MYGKFVDFYNNYLKSHTNNDLGLVGWLADSVKYLY